MQVVKLGGPVYRIGVGGGSASSVEVRDPNIADWFGDLNIFNQQYAVIIYGMFCYSPNLTLCNGPLIHPSKHITHNLPALCYLVIYNECSSWSSISSGLSQVGVLGRLIIGTPVRLIGRCTLKPLFFTLFRPVTAEANSLESMCQNCR
jgi:hypothetical protein